MTKKVIDKLVDIAINYGKVEKAVDEYVFEYVNESTEITKESLKQFDLLKKMKEKLKAQIEILKEVENDR